MKVIVLEGHDLAGKSTLAKELVRHHAARVGRVNVEEWHYGPFTADHSALDEYLVPLQTWVDHATADQVLIIDRFHLGEMVYGELLRGESKLSPKQRDIIEDYLTEINATRILVSLSTETALEERYQQRYESLPLSTVQAARRHYIGELGRMAFHRRTRWSIWTEHAVGALLP